MRNPFRRRKCPSEVLAALHALRDEVGPSARKLVSDMIRYAEIGRDPGGMNMDLVAQIRRDCAVFDSWPTAAKGV